MGGEIDQFPHLQMDSTLAFDAAIEPGERGPIGASVSVEPVTMGWRFATV